jgi:hypothetical protein
VCKQKKIKKNHRVQKRLVPAQPRQKTPVYKKENNKKKLGESKKAGASAAATKNPHHG